MNSQTLTPDSLNRRNNQFRETFVSRPYTSRESHKVSTSQCRKFMLWIDGVGAWQLCAGESFIIGAPSFDSESADIALLANVSRHHATLQRTSEEWRLTAHHRTSVSGREVSESTILRSGDEIRLAERVRLGFRIPSVLSTSAVIDFESDHRPSHSVDGIILLADHCLLGPRRDHHVYCSRWPDLVVLYYQDGQLRCRSKVALTVDVAAITDSAALKHGSVVTADELRFRVEQMD